MLFEGSWDRRSAISDIQKTRWLTSEEGCNNILSSEDTFSAYFSQCKTCDRTTKKNRLLLREQELRETRCLYEEIYIEVVRSPKASIEGESSEFFQDSEPLSRGKGRNFSKSKSLYRGGKLGIFPRPRAYIR